MSFAADLMEQVRLAKGRFLLKTSSNRKYHKEADNKIVVSMILGYFKKNGVPSSESGIADDASVASQDEEMEDGNENPGGNDEDSKEETDTVEDGCVDKVLQEPQSDRVNGEPSS